MLLTEVEVMGVELVVVIMVTGIMTATVVMAIGKIEIMIAEAGITMIGTGITMTGIGGTVLPMKYPHGLEMKMLNAAVVWIKCTDLTAVKALRVMFARTKKSVMM
jgi:hypothetical protein